MQRRNTLSPQTQAAQALHMLDSANGAVVPPMHSASTFARDENYELREGFIYSRYGSPTTVQGEQIIAELEGAKSTLLFNSGMSATVAVVEALPMGAHVVAQSMMYHVGLNWLNRQASRGVIGFDSFEAGNLAALEAAIKPGQTKLVWIETPANGDWSITDIKAASRLAHAAGAILMCDSTAAPPCTTRPLELGADISFHSATKYLNGHSDLTAGVLSVQADLPIWSEIRSVRDFQGTVLPGFEAWLLIRGLRTLFVRYDQASKNALALARHFTSHPAIERVLYPGLPSHPGHRVAAAQMTGGFGGMMSLLVRGAEGRALATAKGCRVFIPATSLGGVESLIEHRRTVAGPGHGIPGNLLRLSIGIEAMDDLIADLEQALDRAG
ncbi:MAG: PLP-dependent aspartate aminotransferase family protein [Rhodobacteraceae bacterium]|nr:PLP-dependent aspartate aminotransferase family protein [Paracoccaceae bacterium]